MGRPVLLSVDDDPGVSRAVARDLRRRYGEEFRVLRASSGPEALDALRELTLRGDVVVAVLADYRMPDMNGVEFLERAMDVVPRARRALLTAYADTDAAIRAINVVDVDAYLLKPWDPPEEKLYPVVDQMIEAWRQSPEASVDGVKLVGHRWSAPSFRARDLLARNAVPYRWYSADEPDGQRLLELAGATPDDVPVIVTAEGAVLKAPSESELATVVGLSVAAEQEFYDLVVVGGGPAGLGAAVYGASEGLRTVLVEREATGGQAGQSSRIENYLGFPDGISGGQLADRARRQARRFGVEMLLTRDCVALEVHGPKRVVRFDDGSALAAHAVVLATGVSYRSLGVPGAEELTGRGVYYGSAMTEAAACAGEKVVIVGGANSAGQAAVFFARYASSVHLLCRGPSLAATMSHYLVEQLAEIDNVHVHTCTSVAEAHGTDHLDAVTLHDARTGEQTRVPVGHLFVFIGGEPRTHWLDGVVVRDERGFIPTGPGLLADGGRPRGWGPDRDPYLLESSVPGVFVAGDVRAESVKRVASAVGEGAMAVTLVHRYLGER
ncbi:FAD-dependent oxidoreductase [Blastococcus sp. TML/M2B]|uniref:FAD-dependent oxidoreductase n=1 Tax=unclassified Blastococcus TaxID=2619396 RepID=UPI001909EFBF|nr:MULTISPECIES: FAD-dependent oxidoreductase [unclassified Blastococcus]MBN1092954.1 FAD-dependent oxidoreductase [Blastococcus sp. TML/M2B]MBN1096940.1 FAD-dependent oxidoreductase [Blastococcus sp. TML/C7B]